MFFLFLAFCCLCLYKIKLNLHSGSHFTDYLSREKSTSIKGIFIILIVFGHFNARVNYTATTDLLYVKILGLVGQITVVTFLFFSGYGIMERVRAKGSAYFATFPKNRILRVALEYWLVVPLMLLTSLLTREGVTLRTVLLTVIPWETNWYVFAILVLYLVTYLVFLLLKDKRPYLNVLLVFAFTVVYIVLMRQWKARFWYDTILTYPLGMLFSLERERVERLLTGKTYKWLVGMGVLAAVPIAMRLLGDNIINVSIGFALSGLFIVLLSMRVSLHNRFLYFLGDHLFEIYLLHMIPIRLFHTWGFIAFSPVLSFLVLLAVTLTAAYFAKLGYGKLFSLLGTKKATS